MASAVEQLICSLTPQSPWRMIDQRSIIFGKVNLAVRVRAQIPTVSETSLYSFGYASD